MARPDGRANSKSPHRLARRAPVSAVHRTPVMRIHLWEHTCCNTIRWSGHRRCDLCGAPADSYSPNVTLEEAMQRLHRRDESPPAARTPEGPPASPARRSSSAPRGSRAMPSAAANRPPAGCRPHRPDEGEKPGVAPGRDATRQDRTSRIAVVGTLAGLAVLSGLTIFESGELLAPVAAILIVAAAPLLAARPDPGRRLQ